MPPLAYHESISSLLENLSRLEQSLGPTELITMWFNDLYFPVQTRPADFPAAAWERGQAEWRACFTDAERAVLLHFHEVFSTESRALSEEWDTWRSDDGWLRVSEAAREALGKLAEMRSNKSLERTRGGQSAKPKRRHARRSAQPLGGTVRALFGISAGAVSAIVLTAGAWYLLSLGGLISDPCEGAEIYGEIVKSHCYARDGVAGTSDQLLLVGSIFGASFIGGWIASRLSRWQQILSGALAILPIQILGAIPIVLSGHRYLYSWLNWYFLGIAIIPGVLGGLFSGEVPPNKSLERTREG